MADFTLNSAGSPGAGGNAVGPDQQGQLSPLQRFVLNQLIEKLTKVSKFGVGLLTIDGHGGPTTGPTDTLPRFQPGDPWLKWLENESERLIQAGNLAALLESSRFADP